MNSRSSINETTFVNFSTDLSTLNPLDTKDSLLSFPFDHIYACHSSGHSQTLHLDKEIEISTQCVIADENELVVSSSAEEVHLSDRLSAAENQNKKLKDLLLYHLDLIQQQNELITKRERLYHALKQENDMLKSRLSRMDRRVVSQRQSFNTSTQVRVAPPAVTSSVIKNEPETASQIMLNSLTELMLPDARSNYFVPEIKSNSFRKDSCDRTRLSETGCLLALLDETLSSCAQTDAAERTVTRSGSQ